MIKKFQVLAMAIAAVGWAAFLGIGSANADVTKCDAPVNVMYRPGDTVTRCTVFYSDGDYDSYQIYCTAGGRCETD